MSLGDRFLNLFTSMAFADDEVHLSDTKRLVQERLNETFWKKRRKCWIFFFPWKIFGGYCEELNYFGCDDITMAGENLLSGKKIVALKLAYEYWKFHLKSLILSKPQSVLRRE